MRIIVCQNVLQSSIGGIGESGSALLIIKYSAIPFITWKRERKNGTRA